MVPASRSAFAPAIWSAGDFPATALICWVVHHPPPILMSRVRQCGLDSTDDRMVAVNLSADGAAFRPARLPFWFVRGSLLPPISASVDALAVLVGQRIEHRAGPGVVHVRRADGPPRQRVD